MNSVKTVLLLGLMTGLILAIGGSIGGHGGLMIALVFALLFNFVSYWFSDRIVLAMYHAKEITIERDPKLH
ncbi:MAG: protease HtpX, partial [Myxococcota bacterium]